jgi:hypothetical protein
MTSKSILMAGASALIFSSAAFTTALAGNDAVTQVRYDSQAEQTRDLNNQSLARAQAQSAGDAEDQDDDGDDNAAVVPTDDRDPQDDQDDGDDEDGVGKDEPVAN